MSENVNQEDWKDARRRGIEGVRAKWRNLSDPVPLAYAYVLLDDLTLDREVIMATERLDGVLVVAFDEMLPRLQQAVDFALIGGILIARGIDPNNLARGKPFVIPANRWGWGLLEPDFERSAATYDGKPVAVGITVERAETATGNTASPVSDAALRWWFSCHKPQSCRAAYAAAKAQFGERVTRDRVHALFEEISGRRRRGRPLKIMRQENAPEN